VNQNELNSAIKKLRLKKGDILVIDPERVRPDQLQFVPTPRENGKDFDIPVLVCKDGVDGIKAVREGIILKAIGHVCPRETVQ
jgi:hypothetical protein